VANLHKIKLMNNYDRLEQWLLSRQIWNQNRALPSSFGLKFPQISD